MESAKRAHAGESVDPGGEAGGLTRGVAARDNPFMAQPTRDLRVRRFRPLLPPAILLEELPLSEAGSVSVTRGRADTVRILRGEDDRLVVVVGPCSVHDPAAGLDYAQRLRKLADEVAAELCIVMRVYFEKPRTTVGWKGLINDPRLDGSFVINEGLRMGRRFLLDLADMGLPAGSEFLDPISPQDTDQFGASPGDGGGAGLGERQLLEQDRRGDERPEPSDAEVAG